MKLCGNCGKPFGLWVTIDGIPRNLASRKFCLECTPFRTHNTRIEIPDEKKFCLICNIELSGNRVKFCSKKCKATGHNKSYHKENAQAQKIRGILRRQDLLDYAQHKCSICGYNKCDASLMFHHIDPATKCFELDARSCSNRKLALLWIEVKKCILVCANCHGEIHDDIRHAQEISKNPH